MLYEDYKDLTVEISILKTDNDMTLIQESDFMLYMQKKKRKIPTSPYLSNMECVNFKGRFEVIAFGVCSSCIITLISSQIHRDAYFYTKISPPPPLLYFRLVISASHSIKMPPSKRSLFFLSKHFFVGFVPRGKHRINNR